MTRKSFLPLGLASTVAAILGTIIFARISSRFLHWMPVKIQIALSLLYLLPMIVWIFVLRFKAKRGTIDLPQHTAFWQNVIRYLIAFDLAMFGFEKYFRLQFVVPLGMLDDPFSAIPREMLMWAFYGHFREMVIFIGSLEIVGALLLVFRRTWLLGAFVLLPVLLNILLLDIFYLDNIVRIYAALETLAVIYLIFIEYDRLKAFFFVAKSNLEGFNFRSKWTTYTLRLSIIVIPLILHANNLPRDVPQVMGKYEVTGVKINNRDVPLNSCPDTVPVKIFIDRSDFVFGYTDYKKKAIGGYEYNDAKKELKVMWRYPQNHPGNLVVKVLPGDNPDARTLTGKMGDDSIEVKLTKVAPVN